MQPRKWSSVTLKSPGVKPRRQNNSSSSANSAASHATNNGTVNAVNVVHTLTTRSHSFTPATEASAAEQSSPINSSSFNAHNQNFTNIQAFSVFANVNIPERNGSKWNSSPYSQNSIQQTISSTFSAAPVPPARTDILPSDANGSEEAPMLPKKPNSASSSQAAFSPTFGDCALATMSRLESAWNISDDCTGIQSQSAQVLSSSIYNNQSETGSDNEPLPSPIPRVVVSPRHEIHSTSNRSPFHSAAAFSKTNCSSSSHFR